ncbi:hypothetical protein GOODEAATRI_031982 [Goodea atripinnis]|uniref:Uncharacterized protein n=1 Tax=Goodea atripinnis TaxID=208336 RepID=A0ABV0P9E5_9TELE
MDTRCEVAQTALFKLCVLLAGSYCPQRKKRKSKQLLSAVVLETCRGSCAASLEMIQLLMFSFCSVLLLLFGLLQFNLSRLIHSSRFVIAASALRRLFHLSVLLRWAPLSA